MEDLQRQNKILRRELKKARLGSEKKANEVKEEPRSPMTEMFTPMKLDPNRRTPGGTQVPPGSPPVEGETSGNHRLPQVLPWPWTSVGQELQGSSLEQVLSPGPMVWKRYDPEDREQREQHGHERHQRELRLHGHGEREGGAHPRQERALQVEETAKGKDLVNGRPQALGDECEPPRSATSYRSVPSWDLIKDGDRDSGNGQRERCSRDLIDVAGKGAT